MIWDPGKKYRNMWTRKERIRHGKLLKHLRSMIDKFLQENPSPKRKGKKHGKAQED